MSRSQNERADPVTPGRPRGVRQDVTLVVLLLISTGCTGLRVEFAPIQECDLSWQGRDAQYVAENFNLHRGRWWDYYRRGQCYLALELYEEAEKDFGRAMRARDRDQWDARMYGMHFTDYFPHRERGIALYYQSEDTLSQREAKDRQDLLLRAIDDLKKSHRQQESSRAKFFLNEAQKAFWRGTDLTPPDVNVASLIYTNQSHVPILVEAVDRESGVAEIRVVGLNDEPLAGHTFELAEKTKAKEIIVPIDPLQPETVVRITCTDVLENASAPSTARIVMDTTPPGAAVTLDTGVPDPDGYVSARVVAVDDGALKTIQVGESADDTYDCGGRRRYERTIRGVPRDNELTVRIVDEAQNATVSRILLSRVSVAPGQSQMDQPRAHPALVLAQRAATEAQLYVAPFSLPGPARGFRLWHAAEPQPTPLRAVLTGGSVLGESGEFQRREFEFPPHVRPPSGGVKITSNDVFYIDGTLYGAHPDTRITVDGREVRNLPKDGVDRVFSHKVYLADLKPDESREIRVEAYRGRDVLPYADALIKVQKADIDPCLGSDSVLGIAVMPFTFGPRRTCNPIGEDSALRRAPAIVVQSLRDLRLYPADPCSYRFRVDDRSKADERFSGSSNARAADAREPLQACSGKDSSGANCVDIVIHGDLSIDCHGDEERFQIKLTAMDAYSGEPLFPAGVLADVYGSAKDLDWYAGELLAAKVGERFPRLKAEVERPLRRQSVRVNRGARHGLFRGMKVCFFWPLDRNVPPQFICGGKVDLVRRFSSDVVIADKTDLGQTWKKVIVTPK